MVVIVWNVQRLSIIKLYHEYLVTFSKLKTKKISKNNFENVLILKYENVIETQILTSRMVLKNSQKYSIFFKKLEISLILRYKSFMLFQVFIVPQKNANKSNLFRATFL